MSQPILIAFREVIQEFGRGHDTGNQQMIAGACTGDIEQVTLGVIDLLQISVVTNRLDALCCARSSALSVLPSSCRGDAASTDHKEGDHRCEPDHSHSKTSRTMT
jgi:hypothetical protein